MGDVQALPKTHREKADPTPAARPEAPPLAEVHALDASRCALCGGKLSARSLRYHVVSPQSCASKLTVCHPCHNAALGEGYRPAD